MGDPCHDPDATSPRPTGVRWRILALLMAYAALCHFNRISMSVAGSEKIMKGYGIEPTAMGVVYTAYLVVYTFFMTPGGFLIDRRGPKFALIVMGFGSAFFVALTGLPGLVLLPATQLLVALCVIRGLTGALTAPIHPGAARAISHWLPFQTHALGNGCIAGAALLGIASTYTAFGFLMDQVGWPMAFVLSGVVTALVAGLWSLYATDDPNQHRSTNAAERQLLAEYAFAPGRKSAADGSIRSDLGILLRNRSLLLLTVSYAAVNYFQYLFFYWMQYYFDSVLQLGKEQGRICATIPTLAMAGGMFAGGAIADLAQLRFGRRRGLALVPVVGMIASAVLLGLGISTRETVWVVLCFALAMAAVGASEGPFWTTAIELGGRRGGTSAAIFNTGGNLGGLLAPVVTPLFSHYFGWQGGFALAGLFSILGAAMWRWIDPAERSPDDARRVDVPA